MKKEKEKDIDISKAKWNANLILIPILIIIGALMLFYGFYKKKNTNKTTNNHTYKTSHDDYHDDTSYGDYEGRYTVDYNDTSNNTYYDERDNIIIINFNTNATFVDANTILNEYITTVVRNKHSKCQREYPNSTACFLWLVDFANRERYLLTNSIPGYKVEPYCPWGIGKGYCFPDGATNCTPFFDMTCPVPNDLSYSPLGDTPVVQWILYNVSLERNPTDSDLPHYLYSNHPQLKAYSNNNSKYFPPPHGSGPPPPPPANAGPVGLHINGQVIFGPNEAQDQNVDLAGITLICGGHVTPPIINGPQYHYHKLTTCLPYESTNNDHGPLLGYGNDGFAIYGLNDYEHKTPIVDECNGHFGYVPCLTEDYLSGECDFHDQKKITYHYHAVNFTYTSRSPKFYAYYLGCQGPSKKM